MSGKTIGNLGIVIPVYNEEKILPRLRERLEAVIGGLSCRVRIYLVDDGSGDGTLELIERWAGEDERVAVVALSRNFGHQAALTAGLDRVLDEDDAVVTMDSDLQDPPEVIPEMISRMNEGHDVVYGKRRARDADAAYKRGTARLFYRLLNLMVPMRMPEDVADFRLINRRALEAIRRMPEQHRYLRGMFSWIGFSQAGVEFDRPERDAGETKYSTRKMVALAWNAVSSFSAMPLRLALLPGLITVLFGIGYCVYSLVQHLRGETVPGWTTLVILLCLFGGSILLALWVIGEYIAKIYEQVKIRPVYLVSHTRNLGKME